jgi:hypothetical protein
MKSSSQEFLQQLTALPADSFEHQLGERLAQLGLAAMLDRNELTLLCEAALRAHLCQGALNDLCGGKISQAQEAKRGRLEWEFLSARDIFYASPGWQTLDESLQDIVRQMFLAVSVADECLAW